MGNELTDPLQIALDSAIADHTAGRLAQAEAAYRSILSRDPNHADALHLLGFLAHQVNRSDIAVSLINRAIAISPTNAIYHFNLGKVFHDLSQLQQASACYSRALTIDPEFFDAQVNLGNLLKDQGELGAAIDLYRRALNARPDIGVAHYNLGVALSASGLAEEAIASFRAALDRTPTLMEAHHNLLLNLHYCAPLDQPLIDAESEKWNQRHAGPLQMRVRPHVNERLPDRRLRIGYVSPDFRSHSVAWFFESLLASHDPQAIETFCYANVLRPDAVTARLQGTAQHWRDISRIDDEKTAELVRNDGIDILVDLAGHTAHNRLLVFARKPAPVQVTYLGYPNTTGMTTMGYRLTDVRADPLTESGHVRGEELVRLPQTFLCYRSPAAAELAIAPLPAASNGRVTFGCFNAMPKINLPLIQLWARILGQVQDSRLRIANRALNNDATRRRVLTLFQSCGIKSGRIELLGGERDWTTHLARHNQVDLALDSFPYCGTTTTCEAMWMGVPVVSLAGQAHVSRVGFSLLNNVGVAELCAQTPDEYVQIAVELANDLPRLARLRLSLRPRMSASPLMDSASFARNVEEAYRRMWHRWCAAT